MKISDHNKVQVWYFYKSGSLPLMPTSYIQTSTANTNEDK